jgi:ornithine carbamoyltransferase
MRQLDAMVWIEDAASRIARGHADAVTREGLHVRLAEPPAFAQGDEVAVRIAPERGAKTLATTARVDSVQGAAGDVECSLVWSAPADERRELDAWLSKAA